ncbi:Tat pathway signal protein [Actinomadura rubrobrunea]|uniref:Tat pathway signal protein n=1 Tax=Actinomadura rubrobrunea TaxID=115335 RepID=A0A9W6UUU6_9ACTN|nr:PhoX family phosphatase [Actinomadura rubrobrunea]GLW63228.1 Tat pathway signal protein [Actinomadura rubrobrunea]
MTVDPDDVSSNPSSNATFGEVVQARMSRRSAIRGGTLLAAAGFLGAGAGTGPAEAAVSAATATRGRGKRGLLGFKAVPTGTADKVVVPEGYTADVLIPWGTPLHSRGPRWKKDASNTAAEQAQQIGMNHDGMQFFPLRGGHEGLLVLNHEYVDQALLFPDGDDVMTKEKVDKALAAHGVSIVKISWVKGRWQKADSRYDRRITGATPVTFSGPVHAAHPALRAKNRPMGTLNNCSSGATPWGTYLACEENWNKYFGTTDTSWKPSPELARYGVSAEGGDYKWHTADPRFDVAVNPNETNRFGWVVEIDPFNPRSTPVKRTALGRIKHESATVTESHGRVVVYTGDDQDGEYVYKFVGSAPWRLLRALGRSPLDHGTLYVAKFNDDGSGTWLPLKHGTGPLTKANGWKDQADVLLRTRQAADAVGATKLDRPEWVAVHPGTKDVYLTLTNGSGWDDKANPRKPNPYGHIIRWRERGGDNTATSFRWDIFLLAGDPAYDSKTTLAPEDVFGSPDGLGFDPDGRLWIQTDVSNSSLNLASKGYDRIGNNQMLAADPRTGEVRRFLVGPRGCEITGFAMTPDGRTLFANVQHPGEATTAWGVPTPDDPRAVSNWPDFDPEGRPRSATLVIRKKDGGVIGA